MARLLAGLALGCLLGSLPSAHLVGRRVGIDVLGSGSGNPGPSNVARLAGLAPAALAFALDVAKSLAAVLVAGTLGEWPQVAAGIGAVIGHNWTPWLRFRGGRGLGVILAAGMVIAPVATLVLIGFLAIGVFTRNLGLLAAIGLCAYPAVALADGDGPGLGFALGAVGLSAIRRLQGSPQVSGATLARAWSERLIYDREPPPGDRADPTAGP